MIFLRWYPSTPDQTRFSCRNSYTFPKSGKIIPWIRLHPSCAWEETSVAIPTPEYAACAEISIQVQKSPDFSFLIREFPVQELFCTLAVRTTFSFYDSPVRRHCSSTAVWWKLFGIFRSNMFFYAYISQKLRYLMMWTGTSISGTIQTNRIPV